MRVCLLEREKAMFRTMFSALKLLIVSLKWSTENCGNYVCLDQSCQSENVSREGQDTTKVLNSLPQWNRNERNCCLINICLSIIQLNAVLYGSNSKTLFPLE